MGNKPRATKYWFKKKNAEGEDNPLPFFIEDNQKDWIEIKDRRELRDIFSQSVHKELNSRFSIYRVFVHKMDIYFTKGVYAIFTQQLKEKVSEIVFNNILFKNNFRASDTLNWHILKPLFEVEGYQIVEDILDSCISVKNIKESESKDTDLKLVKPTSPKK